MEDSYLNWLVRETATTWWNDSADPEEIQKALACGASGATTNPVLATQALTGRPEYWRTTLRAIPADLKGEARAEAVMQAVVTDVARAFRPSYEQTSGAQGYACAQVNPARAGDRKGMLAQARRFHGWAPNIAVKLPVTAAGLDVMEECAAAGITFTATVSFTTAQLLAVAECNERGRARALAGGIHPGRCFVAMMIGRLDDYLREVAQDQSAGLSEPDIRQAGLAVVKRAYGLFRERSYHARIIVAALRGAYHVTELAGAEVIMSIHPGNQAKVQAPGVSRDQGIDRPIKPDILARLQRLPEFVRSYEPDGLPVADFITFGATQRTLSQFSETGWKPMESMQAH